MSRSSRQDLAAARASEPRPAGPGEAARDQTTKEPAPQKKPETKSGQGAPPTPVRPPSRLPLRSRTSRPRTPTGWPTTITSRATTTWPSRASGFTAQQFPDSPLADNALYWIGECRFSQKRFDEAIDAFNEVILTYPDGDKIAAAYLKKGISYMELGKKDEALAAFKLLVAKYPLQEEAKIAQDKIKELTEK